MTPRCLLLAIALWTLPAAAYAAYPPLDHWYSNPLGFSPIALHTGNALWLPALAATAALALTEPMAGGDRWSAYQQSGVAWGYKGPYTSAYTLEAGASWLARRWLGLGAELAFLHYRDGFNDTPGLAVRPMIRWYAVNRDDLRLYFESGAGLVYTPDEFPAPSSYDGRRGLRLNGTTRYGLGAEVPLTGGLHLALGLRHQHVSNGNARGLERNPSHDSNGFTVGLSWRP